MLALLLFSLVAHADNGCDNYCVGVRGNGEAQPAQPTGLSRMVEEFGMPKALSGGSSATVTMFLTAQVRANQKAAGEKDPDRQRKIQALMLKSMPEFESAMTGDAKIADGFGLMQAFSGKNPEMIKGAIEAFSKAGDFSSAELKSVMNKYGDLLNPELVRLVMKDPVKFGPEAKKSVEQLTKFDAVNDDTLFFRPGLVDFKGVAVVLGYMGDFYAGNTDPETSAKFDKYLDDCADSTYRKEWQSVPEDCRTRFHEIAADYLKKGDFANKALFEKTGAHGEFFPTTGVLQGDGLTKYMKMKRDYENGTAKNIAGFSVDFKKDIAFGYWGKQSDLEAASKGIEKFRENGDAKAKKFRSLGEPSWFDVLSTSPAEPGIANAQKIPTNASRELVLGEMAKPVEERWKGQLIHFRKDVMSIGGWSDLHPTEVLKGTPGCDHVVYLTRHADYGDSRFGQQVFIRMTGTTKQIPFWGKIGDGGASGWCDDKIKAAGGNPDEVRDTPWNQISNLCNPQSSFRQSLDASDSTYCTNWDDDANEVFKGRMWNLVKDAYESPLIPTSSAGAACTLNSPPANPDPRALPGCVPYSKRQPGSKPTLEGDEKTGTHSAE
ncbi:MAG: hypothetical protein ACXVCK_08910 [Bdellovibrionota bacterium]